MSKKKLQTIREKLLTIPTFGEIAVEEYIRQYDLEPYQREYELAHIDSPTEIPPKMLLLSLEHNWQYSPQGYDFWEDVYDLIPDEDE